MTVLSIIGSSLFGVVSSLDSSPRCYGLQCLSQWAAKTSPVVSRPDARTYYKILLAPTPECSCDYSNPDQCAKLQCMTFLEESQIQLEVPSVTFFEHGIHSSTIEAIPPRSEFLVLDAPPVDNRPLRDPGNGPLLNMGNPVARTVVLNGFGEYRHLQRVTQSLNGVRLSFEIILVKRRLKYGSQYELFGTNGHANSHAFIVYPPFKQYLEFSTGFIETMEYCGTNNGIVHKLSMDLLPLRSGIDLRLEKGPNVDDELLIHIDDHDLEFFATWSDMDYSIRTKIGLMTFVFNSNHVAYSEPQTNTENPNPSTVMYRTNDDKTCSATDLDR